MYPMGQVPVLQDGDNVIAESNAIARYLCAKNNDACYGTTPIEKAIVDQWMDHFSLVIGPTVGTYYSEEVIKPKIHKKPTDKSKLIEADEKLAKLLPIVEAQLTKRRFLAGNNISIADAVAHGYMSSAEQTSLSFNDYPKIKEWTEGLSATPEWQAMSKRYSESFYTYSIATTH